MRSSRSESTSLCAPAAMTMCVAMRPCTGEAIVRSFHESPAVYGSGSLAVPERWRLLVEE